MDLTTRHFHALSMMDSCCELRVHLSTAGSGPRLRPLPSGLQSFTLLLSHQSPDDVTPPIGLQCLTFGQLIGQSLDGVTLPSCLQSLSFCRRCRRLQTRRRLIGVTLPSGLQSLGRDRLVVDQSLGRDRLVVTETSLGHLRRFRRLSCTTCATLPLPSGLQSLTRGQSCTSLTILPFDSLARGLDLDRATHPSSLQSLTIAHSFNQSLDSVTPPRGRLQSLTFGLMTLFMTIGRTRSSSGKLKLLWACPSMKRICSHASFRFAMSALLVRCGTITA